MFYECDTDFNHYVIEDTNYNGRPARVLYSGDKVAALSGMAMDDIPELLFDYNQLFFEIVQNSNPKSMLLLGGGAFTFPVAVLETYPDIKLDVVEIDGGLLEISRKYFGFRPGPDTQVHIEDGLDFLRNKKSSYDAVIVDVFDDVNIPPDFQTEEFVITLAKHLRKHGMVAINIISSLKGRRSDSLRRMHDLLVSSFPAVQIFPATPGLSSWLPQNFVMVAHDRSHGADGLLARSEVHL